MSLFGLDRGRRFLILISLVGVINSATNGYDVGLLGSFLILPVYTDYFKLTTATTALNNAILDVGGFVAFIYAGNFCDKYGRKWGMALGALTTIVGVILQSAAVVEAMFVVARFFIGLGMTTTAVSAPTYIAEVAHPSNRGLGTSIYNSALVIGSLLAAAITTGTSKMPSNWAWRAPSILQLVPSLICLLFLYFIPESPRWLVSKGEVDQAFGILVKYHGNGNRNDPVVLAEFQEIQETLKFEESIGSSWKALIATPGNRKRTWINLSSAVLSQFVGANISGYYISYVLTDAGYKDPETQLIINTMLTLFTLVCAFVGTFLVDYMGRRPMFIWGTISMMIFLVLTGVLTHYYGSGGNAAGSKSILAMVFLFAGSYNFSWTPLSVLYPVEILSYSTRAKGMSINAAFVWGSAFINIYIIPYCMDAISWKFYLITGLGINGVSLIIIWFWYVETAGKTLEELDLLFDGVKHTTAPDVMEVLKYKDDEEKFIVEKKNPEVTVTQVEG